ncbi:MAG: hypothetical protein AAF571_00425 [Verrucomicrobiota bacterium]
MQLLTYYITIGLLLLHTAPIKANLLLPDREALIFSGVAGKTSESQSVTVTAAFEKSPLKVHYQISGKHAAAFELITTSPIALKPHQSHSISLRFSPEKELVGALEAKLEILTDDTPALSMALYGLSAVGVEGKNEPGMDLILQTLGIKIDIGWAGLTNHTHPELQGSEIKASLFRRAHPGTVSLQPVARYSPNFLLPFGYYIPTESAPNLFVLGTLAQKTSTKDEHNCLFPSLASGQTTFDPGNKKFGIFTSSPSHFAYSEDLLNQRLEPKHVPHAVRVYPARNRKGDLLTNTYLICFEEATNGDYQDYVFLLSNVIPVN